MRKIVLILALLIAAAWAVYPQNVVYTNSVVIAWDAVVFLEDGSPIPAEDAITYEVFRSLTGGTAVSVGSTPNLAYTVTFDTEGEYEVGVRALRYVAAMDVTLESAINWSGTNGTSTPSPFVIVYAVPPAAPEGLGVQ